MYRTVIKAATYDRGVLSTICCCLQLLSRSLAGVPWGHSIPDFYHTIKNLISHNPLPGLISTHCLHLCLIYPVCSPYISLVQFVNLCEVLCVCHCCNSKLCSIVSSVPWSLVPGPWSCYLPVFWINPLSTFCPVVIVWTDHLCMTFACFWTLFVDYPSFKTLHLDSSTFMSWSSSWYCAKH